MKIKSGDTVEVVTGEERGQRGTVRIAMPKENRVVVSGLNLVRKHQRRTGNMQTDVGIIEIEAPIHVSNVMLVCPQCGQPTRVGYERNPDGRKVRVCGKCDEIFD